MAAERKGKKLRRCAKLKGYYASGYDRTVRNKKRRMRTHIRAHPNDDAAVRAYETGCNFGRADSFGLNAKGRKRQRRREEAARKASA